MTTTAPPTTTPFLDALRTRVLVTAGPIGSQILARGLSWEDFGSRDLDGCNEYLNVTRPDLLEEIFSSFYEAGLDCVDSCTFGANHIVLAEYGIAEKTYELNRLGAEIAGRVRDRYSTPEKPRYSMGTIGPGTKLPSLGQADFDTLFASYRDQALGLIDGDISVLKIETCQDLLQIKSAIAGVTAAMDERGKRLPLIVSVTIETTGTMLLGTEIGAALTAIEPYDQVDVIGINCATGPAEMVEHVRYLAEHSPKLVSVMPNAGLPRLVDGATCYDLSPEDMLRYQRIFVEDFGVNLIGGCCGTTPEMLAPLVRELGGRPPKEREIVFEPSVASLYTSVTFQQDASMLIVGERTNANGSRAFRDHLLAGDWEQIVEMARDQAAEGAHTLDVCVDYVGRDGVPDMIEAISRFRTASTLPLVLDSTEAPVIEAGLKLAGGRCIVNSMHLEDGEKKIARLAPLIRQFGAAAVCMLIDEDGQARDLEWKKRVAKRIYDLAIEKYGLRAHDLVFDALTFPLSSGQEDLRGDAMATIEAIRWIKAELPGAYTVLGVSNVSFGLKPAARRVLNSVFLHEAREAGLDAAIVHARNILPLNRIPPEQAETALDLIYDRRREGYDPLLFFVGLFEGETVKVDVEAEAALLPVEERLKRRIIDGRRPKIEADLDEAMERYAPLEIINTILLDGMRVVGELFGSGQMQLPFVLQSAETMKAAVSYLEPHMERVEGAEKGRIVLATVRGDVHDIGKNLVDIILTNNGYKTFNLGIKQPIQNVIEKAEAVQATAIGLSGLLVKSTVVMREDLEELNARELFHYPVLLGGAALNRRYVEHDLRNIYRGRVFYCQDAFEGLHTLDRLAVETEDERVAAVAAAGPTGAPIAVTEPVAAPAVLRSEVRRDVSVPKAPFIGSRVVKGVPLRDVFPYVNEIALFRGQWQYQKGALSDAEYAALVENEVRPVFRRWQERAIAEQLLVPQVVYGFFECQSDGNDLVVYRPDGGEVRFPFPRQSTGKHLCIADFFRSVESGERDVVGFHVVTVGDRASEFAQQLFAANEYRDYLHFHGLSVETAEALAEYWHKRIREELGIAQDDAKEVRGLFAQQYQGSRYSFGYPACPDLALQAPLFELLEPDRIGIRLGETYQIHPEQSTSAIIVHHAEAKYFVVK